MKFDYVLINPPFSLGNAVATECLKHSDKVVCLMPLSKYKKGKLWSKITEFSLADPTLFSDAIITPNLSISVLENNATPKFEDESNLVLEGYSKDFLEVYKWNIKHRGLAFNKGFQQPAKSRIDSEGMNNKTWFIASLRAVEDGIHNEDSEDWKWNHKELDQVYLCPSNNTSIACFYPMKSEKAKDNLTTWWYYKGKKGLANSLLKGLNKNSGSCEDAIPQIDFEKIEENSYWKQGDYDEAVLDAMNLKMNEDGKVVNSELY